jgi:hypothetical protein
MATFLARLLDRSLRDGQDRLAPTFRSSSSGATFESSTTRLPAGSPRIDHSRDAAPFSPSEGLR